MNPLATILRIRGVHHVTVNADHRATVITERPDDWLRVSAALTAAGIAHVQCSGTVIAITEPVVLEDEL